MSNVIYIQNTFHLVHFPEKSITLHVCLVGNILYFTLSLCSTSVFVHDVFLPSASKLKCLYKHAHRQHTHQDSSEAQTNYIGLSYSTGVATASWSRCKGMPIAEGTLPLLYFTRAPVGVPLT